MSRFLAELKLTKGIEKIDVSFDKIKESHQHLLNLMTDFLATALQKADGFIICTTCMHVLSNPKNTLISGECTLCEKETHSFVSAESLKNEDFLDIIKLLVKCTKASDELPVSFGDFTHLTDPEK